MRHMQNCRLPIIAIVALVGTLTLAAPHSGHAAPRLTPAQQAKADAALAAIWRNLHIGHDGQGVTVKRLKAALDEGAQVDATVDSDADTSLMLAALQRNVECVKYLVSKGASVNAKNRSGWTALLWAVCSNSLPCVRTLVSSGADVNSVATRSDLSVLKQAVMCGYVEIAAYLIAIGAMLEARDRHGCTPLMVAVSMNHPECVKLLISHGANLAAKDLTGGTALSLAKDYPRIVAILKAAGAKE